MIVSRHCMLYARDIMIVQHRSTFTLVPKATMCVSESSYGRHQVPKQSEIDKSNPQRRAASLDPIRRLCAGSSLASYICTNDRDRS